MRKTTNFPSHRDTLSSAEEPEEKRAKMMTLTNPGETARSGLTCPVGETVDGMTITTDNSEVAETNRIIVTNDNDLIAVKRARSVLKTMIVTSPDRGLADRDALLAGRARDRASTVRPGATSLRAEGAALLKTDSLSPLSPRVARLPVCTL